jgi:hypothetical protein
MDTNCNEHVNSVFWVSSAICHTVATANNRAVSKPANNRNEPSPVATAGTRAAAKSAMEDGYEDFF